MESYLRQIFIAQRAFINVEVALVELDVGVARPVQDYLIAQRHVAAFLTLIFAGRRRKSRYVDAHVFNLKTSNTQSHALDSTEYSTPSTLLVRKYCTVQDCKSTV